MLVYEIIKSKRDGGALAPDEIDFIIGEYVAGRLPDYQVAALLMTIFYNGMATDELAAWTRAMVYSGDVIEFSGEGPYLDKHSTGGVGDKISLPLAPVLACTGGPWTNWSPFRGSPPISPLTGSRPLLTRSAVALSVRRPPWPRRTRSYTRCGMLRRRWIPSP